VRIIEVMLQGYDKADRIAAEAGINIREVYNAMKRLERKAARVSLRISDLSSAASGQN
jgi:hypothetical protein